MVSVGGEETWPAPLPHAIALLRLPQQRWQNGGTSRLLLLPPLLLPKKRTTISSAPTTPTAATMMQRLALLLGPHEGLIGIAPALEAEPEAEVEEALLPLASNHSLEVAVAVVGAVVQQLLSSAPTLSQSPSLHRS